MAGELSKQDQADREKLCATVRGGLGEARAALLELRDRRLYASTHKTFEAFCQDEFNFGRSHAYRLIEHERALTNLSPIGDKTPPGESKTRVLGQLPEDEQGAAWKEAVATAPDGKPTAKHVQTIVDRRKAEAEPPPWEQPEPEPPTDKLGWPITDPKVAAVFEAAEELHRLGRELSAIKKRVAELCGEPSGKHLERQQIEEHLRDARYMIVSAAPYTVVPDAARKHKHVNKMTKWLTKVQYKNMPGELKHPEE